MKDDFSALDLLSIESFRGIAGAVDPRDGAVVKGWRKKMGKAVKGEARRLAAPMGKMAPLAMAPLGGMGSWKAIAQRGKMGRKLGGKIGRSLGGKGRLPSFLPLLGRRDAALQGLTGWGIPLSWPRHEAAPVEFDCES